MALPTKNLPFEYTQRWTEVGPLLVPSATAAALNLLNKRDKDLEDYLASMEDEVGNGQRHWWAARTNVQQLIATGGSTDIDEWNEFQADGDGEDWTYTAGTGTLTIPPGVYFISGGGTWSTTSVGADLYIRHSPVSGTGIFIGQEITADGGTTTQSFAGTDWYTASATNDMNFTVSQNTGSDRNFDRMHWFIERLKVLPTDT